jgi:outer membrane receptor protein involved in Fe transport
MRDGSEKLSGSAGDEAFRGVTMRIHVGHLVLTSSVIALLAAGDCAIGQTTLPEIVVNRPQPAQKKRTPAPAKRSIEPRPTPAAPAPRTVARRPAPSVPGPRRAQRPPQEPTDNEPGAGQGQGAGTAGNQANNPGDSFDQARSNLLPRTGTNATDLGQQGIAALPQGENTPVDKVLLQFPGVHQESAASGLLHVRNEHGNVQYRINGILLPDGVAGLGQVLETSFIGNIALITGALPAQYGFRTSAGLIDITSKTGTASGAGSLNIYGGSRETITPWFEYGGIVGKSEYFATGRYFATNEGIENTTPWLNPLHDYTSQEKFFGYASSVLDETTRVSFITGTAVAKFQIPTTPGQMPAFTAFGVSDYDSAKIDERQWERTYYNVAAVQKKVNDFDLQVAYFSRYSSVHFFPDPIGDLVFNGVASDVYRSAFVNGIQTDAAYRLNEAHTLRTGFTVSGERTQVVNSSLVEPLDDVGNPIDAPFTITDPNAKTGWLIGTYIQDEWRITNALTLNLGLRFDQMYQFVDANQFSPRANLIYKPWEWTTFHAGYARYFTPPVQVIATPANIALFNNTTQQPAVNLADPVLPERSHYFDAGVDQKLLPGLTVGIDAYYKIARDLLDDGQFGQAYVLTGFNYEKAFNYGVEFKVRYDNGNFRAWANYARAVQMGTNIVSNQFLFDPDELAYIATHYIFTDHVQLQTASGGMSYLCNGTRFSADMIYGSGQRAGFVNIDHVAPYWQVNAGVSHEFKVPDGKPFTLRFNVVNVFDTVYQLRNGTGIGVFAPQFGPRRGYFMGFSQAL